MLHRVLPQVFINKKRDRLDKVFSNANNKMFSNTDNKVFSNADNRSSIRMLLERWVMRWSFIVVQVVELRKTGIP